MARQKQRASDPNTITGRPAFDYLQLTTRVAETFDRWKDTLDLHFHGRSEVGSWGIYRGYTWAEGSVRLGIGKQQGEQEYSLIVSGWRADDAVRRICQEGGFDAKTISVPRCDIQITLPKTSENVRWATLAQEINEGVHGKWGGRSKPQVRGYHSEDGETAYFGSPKSDQMVRLYDKPVRVKGRRELWERFEVQFRNKRAAALLRRVMGPKGHYNEGAVAGALAAVAERWPWGVRERVAAALYLSGTAPEPVVADKLAPEPGARLRWLKSLRNALWEVCMEDGKDGEEAKKLMGSILARAHMEDDGGDYRGWKMVSPQGEVFDVQEIDERWLKLSH